MIAGDACLSEAWGNVLRQESFVRLAHLAAPALLIAAPAPAQDITGSWTSTQLLLNAEKEAWAAPECIDATRWSVDCPGPRPSPKAPAARSEQSAPAEA